MGASYEWNENPFQDLLMNLILNDQDISDRKLKKEINGIFIEFLENILNDPKDALYLDFEIINKKNKYSVIGKNFISSLWLSGYFLTNVDEIMASNVFIAGDRKFVYNEKTLELKISNVNEKDIKDTKKLTKIK